MPTYFLTGANRGIGLEFVRQLSASPTNTIIAAVRSLKSDLSALKTLAATPSANVHIIECDVSSTDSIASLEFRVAEILSQTGSDLNFLFNVAGINATSSDTSLSMEIASMASLALGFIFVGSGNGDVTGAILQTMMEREEKQLSEKWTRFMSLGLALLYLGACRLPDCFLRLKWRPADSRASFSDQRPARQL